MQTTSIVWHITENGPSRCKAISPASCPFKNSDGTDSTHYVNGVKAMEVYLEQEKNNNETFTVLSKKSKTVEGTPTNSEIVPKISEDWKSFSNESWYKKHGYGLFTSENIEYAMQEFIANNPDYEKEVEDYYVRPFWKTSSSLEIAKTDNNGTPEDDYELASKIYNDAIRKAKYLKNNNFYTNKSPGYMGAEKLIGSKYQEYETITKTQKKRFVTDDFKKLQKEGILPGQLVSKNNVDPNASNLVLTQRNGEVTVHHIVPDSALADRDDRRNFGRGWLKDGYSADRELLREISSSYNFYGSNAMVDYFNAKTNVNVETSTYSDWMRYKEFK